LSRAERVDSPNNRGSERKSTSDADMSHSKSMICRINTKLKV